MAFREGIKIAAQSAGRNHLEETMVQLLREQYLLAWWSAEVAVGWGSVGVSVCVSGGRPGGGRCNGEGSRVPFASVGRMHGVR